MNLMAAKLLKNIIMALIFGIIYLFSKDYSTDQQDIDIQAHFQGDAGIGHAADGSPADDVLLFAKGREGRGGAECRASAGGYGGTD